MRNTREKGRIKKIVVLLYLMAACSACSATGAEPPVLGETDVVTEAQPEGTNEITTEENARWKWESLHTYACDLNEYTRIDVQEVDGVHQLVLPSTVSPSSVSFWFADVEGVKIRVEGSKAGVIIDNGEVVDLTALCENDDYNVTFSMDEIEKNGSYEVKVMFSENVATMYLCSDDPVEHGREWVEDSGHKTNKATGHMLMQDADGSMVYDGVLTQIKGRGNSTWQCVKKPYQIKIESKTDLLEIEGTENKSKTWVLLANYFDNTLIRNALTLNIGNALGMQYNIESRWVDLYYDAEYRGAYLLTEKVEIGDGRVDMEDLEKANEDLNPNMEESAVKSDTTENGALYYYCENMISPEDYSGGYLLELDFEERAKEEVCYFVTSRNYYVVVKSPEYASKEEMEYIATLYQEFEDAVYNDGVNPVTGKHFSEYVDLESMAMNYLINEWTRNRDGFVSSTYFCKEAGQDTMIMGPLWDFDLCLGIGGGDSMVEKTPVDSLRTAKKRLGRSFCKLSDFCNAVKTIYANDFRPLIQEVVLGDVDAISEDGSLHSLSYYAQKVKATAECNMLRWHSEQNWEEEVEYMRGFVSQRIQYLDKVFDAWVPGQSLSDIE